MSFFRIFEHLLPDSKAWRITVQKTLRKFVDGLANGVPTSVRGFVDDVWEQLFPATTTELTEWETQFGIVAAADEPTRRQSIAAAWAAQGGQSPSYLQNVLQDAGFDVFVYEWWSSGPPYVARDPRDYTDQPLIGTVQCGEPLALCGEPSAECNELLANFPGYIVNGNLTHGAPPLVPDDPNTWPYFLYIGANPFPNLANISDERRFEFERLILKYRPAQQWIVTLITYDAELLTESGENILTELGEDIIAAIR